MSVSTTTQRLPWVYEKDVGVRAVSGVSSALSILGSALIILSYVCFRSLRTRARLILVHLALTDMGVGLANLVGIIADFDSYYDHSPYETGPYQPNKTIMDLCKTQAFAAEYCTLSSVLWTSCMAIFMYMLIMSHEQKQTKYFLWFSYPFCYGIPLFITVWMVATGRLGYSPYDSSGWCGPIILKPFIQHEILVSKVDFVAVVIGYDLWIILTMILIVVLYISIFAFIRLQHKELAEDDDAAKVWQAMHNMDSKFLAIPLMFIFLRIWSLIMNILIIYCQIPPNNIAPWALRGLQYMIGMGDSGQGFINALLFVAFTQSVRKHLFSCFYKFLNRWRVLERRKQIQEKFPYSKDRVFYRGNPAGFTSKKYDTLPQGEEAMYSASNSEKRMSFTPLNSEQSSYCNSFN